MASISKRKNKWVVIYYFEDANGEKKQKWETFDSNSDAKKRKAEVEDQQNKGIFIVPTAKTVGDLMDDYVTLYGVEKWAISTYNHSVSLINNYILPIIGDVKLTDLSTRLMEKYYQSLSKVKTKTYNGVKPQHEFVQPATINKVHKLLNSAFNQACKWELIPKNPCTYATVPKHDYKKRSIWDADTVFKAIELCDDEIIKLAINLAFCCCLRMGEMLGLTWDCVEISQESIAKDIAYVYVKKELQRADTATLDALENKDVIFRFPSTMTKNTTTLVLKLPKTKSSVRKIFLPSTVAQMLIERKQRIAELKDIFGCEYHDYDLIFCQADGKPLEGAAVTRGFKKLIADNDLPPVVFHSLRHTSITYKLKLNGGDMKSVQGDSGHSQMKMVADVYSHIMDDDRQKNAQLFEQEFYSKVSGSSGASSPRKEKAEDVPTSVPQEDSDQGTLQMLLKLMQDPKAAELLKTLAKTL
jgi:integrase